MWHAPVWRAWRVCGAPALLLHRQGRHVVIAILGYIPAGFVRKGHRYGVAATLPYGAHARIGGAAGMVEHRAAHVAKDCVVGQIASTAFTDHEMGSSLSKTALSAPLGKGLRSPSQPSPWEERRSYVPMLLEVYSGRSPSRTDTPIESSHSAVAGSIHIRFRQSRRTGFILFDAHSAHTHLFAPSFTLLSLLYRGVTCGAGDWLFTACPLITS